MPLYDFRCRDCGDTSEHWAKIEEKTRPCDCGSVKDRLITTCYNVLGDVDFVTEDISGEPIRITSRRQHRRLMKEHGVQEKYGKGWV